MTALSTNTESTKHFTKEVIHHVMRISVSITICTKQSAKIPVNHWAIPREMWREMEAAKEDKKQGRMTEKKEQQLLDFKTVSGP